MDGMVRKLAFGLGWNVDNDGLVEANAMTDGLTDEAEEAESAMGGLSDAGEGAGNEIAGAFAGVKETISGGVEQIQDMKMQLTGMAAAGGAAIFGFTNMAGDLEERLNTLDREFGRSSSTVRNWARDYADATELTEMQLVDWSATLGINFRMLDLTAEQTAGLTEEMIKLTHNYAHFMDMEPEQAFNSIHQAIRGGRFPRALRDLTGQVRQADIEQRAYQEGLVEQGEELDSQAERLATLSLLQEELAITQGAAEEGQSEWNTQMTQFRGLIGDISRDMGNTFMPSLGRGLGVVNDFLGALRENRLARVAAGFLGISTAIAGLGAGIGILAKVKTVVIGLIGAGAGLLGIAKLPFLAIIAGATVALGIIEDLWVGFRGGESAIFNARAQIGKFVDDLKESDTIAGDFVTGFSRGLKIITGFLGLIYDVGGLVQDMFKSLFTMDASPILERFDSMYESIQDISDGLYGLVPGVDRESVTSGLDWVSERVTNINPFSDDTTEREAQETQRAIERQRQQYINDVDVGEIKVEAADDPQETGRAVKKEIETYLDMEAAEAGAN